MARLLAAFLLLASCRQDGIGATAAAAGPAAGEDTTARHLATHAAQPAAPDDDGEPPVAAAPEPADPITPAITHPALLAELEGRGLSFADLLGAGGARGNAALHASSARYRQLVAFTEEDIAASIEEENRHRPDWGEVGTTLRQKRRNLDPAWLSAGNARFELAGVVNRMDRAPFHPGTCGELRLLYRLAYQSPRVASRLPFTVNVVFLLEPGERTCAELAAEWRLPTAPTPEWLTSEGPLRSASLRRLKSIEVNYQVIRTASAIRNQMGGAAEYVLRVFHDRRGRLVRAPLENTPDVARLTSDPTLRAELLAFLRDRDNLRAIDQGTILVPERFLAVKARSFAPHALARQDNRPFDALFEPGDFSGLDLSGLRVVRSPAALLRRLDDLTCVGCHQGRTVAGFHFLGEDRAGSHPLNEVYFAGSGHFRADLVRRVAYLEELERGARPDDHRPLSIAPTGARASYGDLCSLPGSSEPETWRCEDGLTCQEIAQPVGGSSLGHCFPDEPRAGDPCLQSLVIQDHHSLDKMVMPWTELGCAEGYACRMPGLGFPSGMCTSSCDAIATAGEICGPTAGPGFADCLAGRASFQACLERHGVIASRGRCSAHRSCRNDYVCARTGDEPDGACVPAYFLFQLRVDGHPPPK